MNDQLPPASLEAEEALLGGLIFDPRSIERIQSFLPSNAFYALAHQVIYKAMLSLYSSDKLSDLINLSAYLKAHKDLENIGGMNKLSHLLNSTISARNIDRYARLILEKYQLRRLIALGEEIVELGYDQRQELSDIYAKIKSLLPSEITGASPEEPEIKIKVVRYSLYNQEKTKKLEMEAEIKEGCEVLRATGQLAAEVEQVAQKLWDKE